MSSAGDEEPSERDSEMLEETFSPDELASGEETDAEVHNAIEGGQQDETGGDSEGDGECSDQSEKMVVEGVKGAEVEVDDAATSEVLEGEDLQEDLQYVLDEENFDFTGSFYHASLLTSTPNPCLRIGDLGVIGLPLSERDAQAVISSATLAPFGHGERTVIDKSVRDTWEIEPTKISFDNPHWESFVNSIVLKEVCKSLGVTTGDHAPRLELYKLLLYEAGSHFLPHQDTQKADGMFATVIIILPSGYTGGQVVVSRSTTSKTIDFSASSKTSTALLAWYTDVKHEVKEVTSGYRLALSYNLIQDSSKDIPLPVPSNMDVAANLLRRILMKWKEGRYADHQCCNLVAFLLDHQYSTSNLRKGLKTLKGVDAHRVIFVRSVAEEFGFKVGLASLKHNVSGAADDDGCDYYARQRRCYSEEEESEGRNTPSMAEVGDESTELSGFVDLKGNVLLPIKKLSISPEELVPKEPFEDQRPDQTDYEGYMGNGAGQLDYWYHRTVLVIIPESNVDEICFSAEGVSYAMRKLKASSAVPPTESDLNWMDRILEKGNTLKKEQVLELLDYVLEWQDLTRWKKIAKLGSCSLQAAGFDTILKAWQLFSFEDVRVSFEEMLARSTEFQGRLEFLFKCLSMASPKNIEIVFAWYQKEANKIFSSYRRGVAEDVPIILSVIKMSGLQYFKNTLMAKLLRCGTYPFWMAFIKALRQDRDVILDQEHDRPRSPEQVPAAPSKPPSSSAPTAAQAPGVNEVDTLMKQFLQAAVSNLSCSSSISAQTVMEVVGEACVMSDMDTCQKVFAELLDSKRGSQFRQSYSALVPRLAKFLTDIQLSLLTAPFVDLFRALVGLYLKDVLGQKHVKRPPLRKVGCGCADCKVVDAMMMDTNKSTVTLRVSQARRTHLERRLASARDICTCTTIRSGSPFALQVTKLPAVMVSSTWASRQRDAKAFLASIGPHEIISQIMGPRYGDVQKALEGMAAFSSPKTTIPSAPTAATSSTGWPPLSSVQVSHAMRLVETPIAPPIPRKVAGRKRKSLVQLGPVIDLTDDD